jgi:hypothetical protein
MRASGVGAASQVLPTPARPDWDKLRAARLEANGWNPLHRGVALLALPLVGRTKPLHDYLALLAERLGVDGAFGQPVGVIGLAAEAPTPDAA